jgi:hypothetical protein
MFERRCSNCAETGHIQPHSMLKTQGFLRFRPGQIPLGKSNQNLRLARLLSPGKVSRSAGLSSRPLQRGTGRDCCGEAAWIISQPGRRRWRSGPEKPRPRPIAEMRTNTPHASSAARSIIRAALLSGVISRMATVPSLMFCFTKLGLPGLTKSTPW